MEGLRLFFFLAALATLLSASASAVPSRPDLEFIRASSRPTRYRALCESSLSGYASAVRRSPRQLAHAALAVTLARARSASAFVGRLGGGGGSREAGAVQDCIENVGDSVDRLRRSAAEMG